MRRGSYILVLAFMGALALVCSPVSAQPYDSDHRSGGQVDVGIFYDNLAPYGEWVEMPEYGWSWAPRVSHGWRPYTRGQWVMTDDGWFWDSEEPFGWAAYHYGRWINDPYYGWVWVPGTEWAPAWVSWRHGNGYTGWAPLPPRATWRTRIGLSIGGLDIDAFIGSDDYAFVPDRSFVDRGVYQRVLPPAQNVTIINVTSNVTNYTVANDRVFNGGITLATVEQAVGRPVPRVRTVDVDRADGPRYTTPGEVSVFRPEVRADPGRRPAQGTSLVKGDQPPPLLVERRTQREQETRQGNAPALTAKDAAQQRGPARGTAGDASAQPQTARPDGSSQQRARQASDAEAEAAKRARDAQQVHDQKQSDQKQSDQMQRDQQVNPQHAKQAGDAEAEAARRAPAAQQVLDQKPSGAKQGGQSQGNQPQADQQRPKPPQQEAKAKPKAKPKDEPKDKPKEEKK